MDKELISEIGYFTATIAIVLALITFLTGSTLLNAVKTTIDMSNPTHEACEYINNAPFEQYLYEQSLDPRASTNPGE